MWVVDPKWYYMGCRRNLKYIFVDGGIKRKLNYMDGRVDKKVPSQVGCTYFWNSPELAGFCLLNWLQIL